MPTPIASSPLRQPPIAAQRPTITVRRTSSEEYAEQMRLQAYREINKVLATRNLAKEEELRVRAQEAKEAKGKARAALTHTLSSPSEALHTRRHSGHGTTAFETIPLDGLARRRSTPGNIEMPSPTLSPPVPGRVRTPRHYFDLTPQPGSAGHSTPRGDYFTPMEAPATVIEPEPVSIKERVALAALVIGMGALAMPIIILVVKAIQLNIEKLRGNPS